METTEQIQTLQRIVAKNAPFENLLTNDDFLYWRDNVVKTRIDGISKAILSVDTTVDGWRDKACNDIIRYQEANLAYNTLFTLAEMSAKQARQQLVELTDTKG